MQPPPHFYGGAGLRRLQQQERTVLLSKHPWKSWIFESRIIFEGIVFHFRSFWFQALMWLVVQARCIPGRPCRAPRARMGLVHHSECQLWSCWGSLPKSWLSWRATTTRVPLLEVLWLPRIIELWPLSYVIITLKTLWDKQRDQSASFFVGTRLHIVVQSFLFCMLIQLALVGRARQSLTPPVVCESCIGELPDYVQKLFAWSAMSENNIRMVGARHASYSSRPNQDGQFRLLSIALCQTITTPANSLGIWQVTKLTKHREAWRSPTQFPTILSTLFMLSCTMG